MQTFLPYTNAVESAMVLDNKRLNKQILEGYQILNVLSGNSKGNGWKHHPAVLMWKGSEHKLWKYIQFMIKEAQSRGIKTDKNEENLNKLYKEFWHAWGDDIPLFLQDYIKAMRVITTHRANLFDKDPIYYNDFSYAKNSVYNQPCCPTCKYYWVTHE